MPGGRGRNSMANCHECPMQKVPVLILCISNGKKKRSSPLGGDVKDLGFRQSRGTANQNRQTMLSGIDQ